MNNLPHRSLVRIKGVKDGFYFLLDDTSEWQLVIDELEHKLMKTHQQLLSGPVMDVFVKLGQRDVTTDMREQITSIICFHGNLKIKSIESANPVAQDLSLVNPVMRVERGVVRSGQKIQFDTDVLFLGDVNPGGTILSSGNIYIMGSLRGMAHAGMLGNESAMILASFFKPTQLRIADLISRPPDEWRLQDEYMDCAYIHEGRIEIEKIHQLHKIHIHPVHTLLKIANQ